MNLHSTFFAHVLSKSPLISVQCQLQQLALQLFTSWNWLGVQAGDTPAPRKNQTPQFYSHNSLSQCSWEKDKGFRGGWKNFPGANYVRVPEFCTLSYMSLEEKKKKSPQTNILSVSQFPGSRTFSGYSLPISVATFSPRTVVLGSQIGLPYKREVITMQT